MTLNEKQELANLLAVMADSHRETLNKGSMSNEKYEDAQIKFREAYFETAAFVENIKCSDDNTPHNFTPDVENIEEHIDSRSNKKSRLMLVYYSLASLMLESVDGLGDAIPHRQKLKQVCGNYTKLLEDEVRTAYALAGDNQLHFSQWQNLIKLSTTIFIKAIIDDKAHDYLGFLVAFANGECKYEITDKEFSKKDVDNQAAWELWELEIKEKEIKEMEIKNKIAK